MLIDKLGAVVDLIVNHHEDVLLGVVLSNIGIRELERHDGRRRRTIGGDSKGKFAEGDGLSREEGVRKATLENGLVGESYAGRRTGCCLLRGSEGGKKGCRPRLQKAREVESWRNGALSLAEPLLYGARQTVSQGLQVL